MSELDFLIAFSIFMLILALINERIANFLKIYFQDKTIFIPFLHKSEGKLTFFLRANLKIIAYKQPTKSAEKEREYRIIIINILIGFIIATLLNANLFQIAEALFTKINGNFVPPVQGWQWKAIAGKPENYILGGIFWLVFLWSISLVLFNNLAENENKKHSTGSVAIPIIIFLSITILIIVLSCCSCSESNLFFIIITHVLGFLGTGVFLSLGSKFWHDFLDLLFWVKNARQTLSEKGTYTNYSSANEIVTHVETPRDTIVQKFCEKHQAQILQIDGVVSCGISTVFDSSSNLYKKIIEVEFTSSFAQTALNKIIDSSFLKIDYNNFYLKDYTKILYTKSIEILVEGMYQIKNNNPICYAYNSKSPNSVGSFGVIEKEGKYYAISNLHVFATPDDLLKVHKHNGKKLENKDVILVINGKRFHKTLSDDYKFGNHDGYGYDFCKCEIDKSIYDKYNLYVDQQKLKPKHDKHMTMFGARSKYIFYKPDRHGTPCNINYNSFKEKLYLFKITPKTSVKRGDSGSIIYYSLDDSDVVFRGVLVAKTDNYAYMFRLII
jgi:hypothetical protein